MKKLILVITLAMVFAFSNMAMAEQPQITVGLKTWFATWETKSLIAGDSIESDYGVMYGPAINVKYDKLFAGINYMIGSFSFPEQTDFYVDTDDDGFFDDISDLALDADRTDIDLFAGYYFHPNIAGILGYKSMDFDLKADYIDAGTTETASVKFSGPALGIMGHYLIEGTRWALFGNLSYLILDGEVEGESIDGPSGTAIEFGGAYAVETMPLSVSVGLKIQNYSSDDVDDTFSGLTFGVNYTIQ